MSAVLQLLLSNNSKFILTAMYCRPLAVSATSNGVAKIATALGKSVNITVGAGIGCL